MIFFFYFTLKEMELYNMRTLRLEWEQEAVLIKVNVLLENDCKC